MHGVVIPVTLMIRRGPGPALCRLCVAVMMAVVVVTYVYNRQTYVGMYTTRPTRVPNSHFLQALHERSDANRTILLALVDSGFMDMAVNFYRTSLKPFGITSFLFVSTSGRACRELRTKYDLPCVNYTEVEGDVASDFFSRDFIQKMNIRTELILDALSAGYTVINTDLDVVFFRNPLPELVMTSQGAGGPDIAALWDDQSYNAGFLVIRPTPAAIGVYALSRQLTLADPKLNDQSAINRAIGLVRWYLIDGLTVVRLDETRYQCGVCYFETGRRMFAGDNPCENCVVVHNNWIVSKAAKVYRFKEHHVWFYEPLTYFSSPAAKYMTYRVNPIPHSEIRFERLRQEFETAILISHILDRILILPRFPCAKVPGWCPLNTWFNVSSIDKGFGEKYRESSFLDHVLVPNEVKGSKSVTFHIRSGDMSFENLDSGDVTLKFDPAAGISSSDVVTWFGDVTERVLVLGSLEGVVYNLESVSEDLVHKVTGITAGNYRQL